MKLRDYQSNQIGEVRHAFRQGNRSVVMQLATGAGKTVMASSMLQGAAARGKPVMFTVHRKELVDQTAATFDKMGIEHGIVASGYPETPAPVQIGSILTVARRLDRLPEFELVVIDECHHATAPSWAVVLSALSRAHVVGLTATPERLDGKGLNLQFDALVTGPSTKLLIDQGHLSPYKYFAPGKPDMLGVRTTAGDFNRGDLSGLMDRPKLIGDVVKHYQRLAPGERGIVFAVSIDHSRSIVAAFNDAGIKAAHVDGSMSKQARGDVVDSFRDGSIDIMSNVDLFGEGFDVPEASYCGLARPTKSLALFLQQCGRALRPSPGKQRAIIADHAGNAFHHGLPCDERSWSLEGKKARLKADDALPIKSCPDCFRVVPSTVMECPGCGHVWVVEARVLEEEEGELEELTRAREAKQKRISEEAACVTLSDWEDLARRRGYKPGWAWHRFRKAKPRTSGSRAWGGHGEI